MSFSSVLTSSLISTMFVNSCANPALLQSATAAELLGTPTNVPSLVQNLPENLDVLQATSVPERDTDSIRRDNLFASRIGLLLSNGDLTENTFVIMYTGHNIPMAATLACDSSNNVAAVGSFVFPELSEISDGSTIRINQQAYIDAAEINQRQQDNLTEGINVIYLAIDAHDSANSQIDPNILPTAAELQAAEIEQILLIDEGTRPLQEVNQNNIGLPTLDGYFQSLSTDISISLIGVDSENSILDNDGELLPPFGELEDTGIYR